MPPARVVVAASVLDADFGNLYRVVRKLERAGVDRLHLDVMDGHFVPNISFGPAIVGAFRRLTELPLDVHLMIAEPSRYVSRFIEAGSDSITFHIEVGEPRAVKEQTLATIRQADRRAGLAVSPGTSVGQVRSYLPMLDLIMIMTVEPGFGGQRFMAEKAPKLAEACALFSGRPDGWEVHVDGGLSGETADVAAEHGADVLVVGSALFQRGHDMSREVELVRRRADEARARREKVRPSRADRRSEPVSIGSRERP
ncbi:MAG TPA: ribulose-phosphate 3-epimerase [Candidatus Limnocylindrales bacterium]|jgi:ribulose-phosphate 3-epimerase|nr:ribulose-phosphate 3-epimerase [Candidatus Limnocylindrales bacterium]